MTQILVYRLNREIKMPRNANMLEKYREIKMPRKFDAAKISCFKVVLKEPVFISVRLEFFESFLFEKENLVTKLQALFFNSNIANISWNK